MHACSWATRWSRSVKLDCKALTLKHVTWKICGEQTAMTSTLDHEDRNFYKHELWKRRQMKVNLNLNICPMIQFHSMTLFGQNKSALAIYHYIYVISYTSKYQHITPTLKKLHWLPIKQRIDYKLCLLAYKTLTNQQPTYLYSSLSFPSHSVSTRSSDSLVRSIPYVRSSLGKRAFSVIGLRLWNSLPPDTRNSSSLPIFRSRLKTHFFKIAFPP